jgi:hypothetical protein
MPQQQPEIDGLAGGLISSLARVTEAVSGKPPSLPNCDPSSSRPQRNFLAAMPGAAVQAVQSTGLDRSSRLQLPAPKKVGALLMISDTALVVSPAYSCASTPANERTIGDA